MVVSSREIGEKSALLQDLLGRACRIDGAERRENQRHPLSETLIVQPLDDDLQPQGEEFRVITRDVSAYGIGFVHSEPIEQSHLRIGIPDRTNTELLVEVKHCSAVGELGLLFLIGVQDVDSAVASTR